MLSVNTSLHGVDESVTRPLVIQLTNDIKHLVGLHKEVVTIYDTKEIVRKKGKDGVLETTNTIHDECVVVKYQEDTTAGMEISHKPIQDNTEPFYHDEDIGATFAPIYHDRTMELDIEIYSKSKDSVLAMINRLKIANINDDLARLHTFKYYYTVPRWNLKLLKHLNDLKNLRHPVDGQIEIDSYINNTFDDRIELENTLDGDISKSEIAILENQTELEGYITTAIHDITPVREDDSVLWSISITYKIQYEKPILVHATYPFLVYNTLVNNDFRKFRDTTTKGTINAIRHRSTKSLYRTMDKDSIYQPRKHNAILHIPSLDNHFTIKSTPRFLSRIFSIMVVVDIDKPRELFNINKIPRYPLKESVIDFIMAESVHGYSSKLYDSLILFELYKDGVKINTGVVINTEGMMTALQDMDIKSTYRVVISIVNDLSYIRPTSQTRIKNYIKSEVASSIGAKRDLPYKDRRHTPDKEVVVNRELFIDNYFSLFSIPDRVITNMYKTISPEEMLFRFREPKYMGMMTKETHHTIANLINLDKEK